MSATARLEAAFNTYLRAANEADCIRRLVKDGHKAADMSKRRAAASRELADAHKRLVATLNASAAECDCK